jgi:hypothetical protein
MRISTIALFIFLVFQVACTRNQIRNIHLDGELIAKQIITARYDPPAGYILTDISWYISKSPDGEWEKLPGIWTNQVVLLTSYVGKYLKSEISMKSENSEDKLVASIISSRPVEYKGNPDTDWFHDAGFGIMFHYLSSNIVPEGGSKEWNDAVNSFDAEKFSRSAAEAGAGFVMVTLGQNSGYYCSPNAVFDSVVGVRPGELCSVRDMPMDVIKALKKYNIPVILYLPSNPPVGNKLVSEKFRYPLGKDSATSQYNQPILENIIREWSLRYGTAVKGWWFDGLYEWNAIRSTRMDMSLKHNISTHTLAAKAGNKHSIVTYNYGFGKIHVNTPYCDYSSGEKQTIDEIPSSRWVEDGVQWFLFTYLGEKWGGKGQQFKTEELTEKAKRIVDNGGVLCLEVVVDAKGNILPHHLEQIKAVGKALGKAR